jgi:hypothetical protein
VRPLRRNARDSIRDNFDFESNEIELNDVQHQKHESQITSTDAGRWIVVRPLRKKVLPFSSDNFEFDSNEIDVSELQFENENAQRISTDAGR